MWRRVLLAAVLLAAHILLAADTAHAATDLEKLEDNGGHFRFATVRWQRITGNTVKFTLTSAWRRDYSSEYFKGSADDSLTQRGDTIVLNGRQWPVFDFGDTSVDLYLKMNVNAYSVSENWVQGVTELTHTYATPNNAGSPWVAHFTGCCRVPTINPGTANSWDLSVSIDLLLLDESPQATPLPIARIPFAPDTTVQFPSAAFHRDHAGADLTYSLATPVQGQSVTSSLDQTGMVSVTMPASGLLSSLDSPGTERVFECKVQVSMAGLYTQLDMLVVIYVAADPPVVTISGGAYPSTNHTLNSGFHFGIEVSASSAASSTNVGFTVGTLPSGLTLSTVAGLNPVTMNMEWMPCEDQLGFNMVCVSAVDASGQSSVPACVLLHVQRDTPPVFSPTPSELIVTMGDELVFSISASDTNCQDQLLLTLDGSVPEGATLSVQSGGSSCTPATRTLTWVPSHLMGGMSTSVCFNASDACGGCACSGKVDSVSRCIELRVSKCRYTVRTENQLGEVAQLFGTDWLTLFSMNAGLRHPDYLLFDGQPLVVGRMLTVSVNDNLQGIANRFGTTVSSLQALNNDLVGHSIAEGQDLCVVPNACVGETESSHLNSYRDAEWFKSSRDAVMPRGSGDPTQVKRSPGHE